MTTEERLILDKRIHNQRARLRWWENLFNQHVHWHVRKRIPGFHDLAARIRANARNLALEEAAKLIEEGFDRPGIAKKQDTCAHGKFGWEDCEKCAVAVIRALKAEGESR